LIYFTAKAEGSVAQLTWATAQEKNNASFVIERSPDGIHFQDLGSVNGNGNTQQVSTYSYTDEQPLNGTSYYRLRQIDYNSTSTRSSIASVSFVSSAFYLFPNPAREVIHLVTNSDEPCDIAVYSNLGVEVKQLSIEKNNNTYTIHLTGIATGSYILQVSSTHQQTNKPFLVY
jgi:hypothetical protein